MKLDDPRDPSRMRLTNSKVRESRDREEIRELVNNHLLLIGTGIWAGQQFNALSQRAVLNAYPTAPYHGSQYVIVPQSNTLPDQKGNIWIKIQE